MAPWIMGCAMTDTVTSNLITMDKKYQTRDGRAVRILCVDGPDNLCVVGIVEKPGWIDVYRWTINGVFCWGQYSENDLIPVPTKHEMWAVVYADGDCRHAVRDRFLFSTEAFAQGAADAENREHPSLTHGKAHIARVTWEA